MRTFAQFITEGGEVVWDGTIGALKKTLKKGDTIHWYALKDRLPDSTKCILVLKDYEGPAFYSIQADDDSGDDFGYIETAKKLTESTNEDCVFFEPAPGKWYFAIQHDRNREDYDGAEVEGPFPTQDDAEAWLSDNHANPGGWDVQSYADLKSDAKRLARYKGYAAKAYPPTTQYYNMYQGKTIDMPVSFPYRSRRNDREDARRFAASPARSLATAKLSRAAKGK
jgi:hypothetical protein